MKIDFFSIINSSDDKYRPICDNFLHYIKKVGLKDDHELIEVSGETDGFFGEGFQKIVYKKLEITYQKLLSNNNVWLSDLDIVFLKNPKGYLLDLLNDYDIIFQNDRRFCTGFYMAKPTPLTIELFNSSQKISPWGGDQGDQGYINAKYQQQKDKYKDLKIKVLDDDLFPHGLYWCKEHKRKVNPYIVHYNWISSHAHKIGKMKKFDHWHH